SSSSWPPSSPPCSPSERRKATILLVTRNVESSSIMIWVESACASLRMPIHGSVFSVVQTSTSRPRYSASFFSIPDLPVARGLEGRLVVGPEHLLGPADVQVVPGEVLRD